MRKLAEETGISRQGLYNALSAEGNANLDTMLR
jgi:DNA-binding phage protein